MGTEQNDLVHMVASVMNSVSEPIRIEIEANRERDSSRSRGGGACVMGNFAERPESISLTDAISTVIITPLVIISGDLKALSIILGRKSSLCPNCSCNMRSERKSQFQYFCRLSQDQNPAWEIFSHQTIKRVVWDAPLHCIIRLVSSVARTAVQIAKNLYVESCFHEFFGCINITGEGKLDGPAAKKLMGYRAKLVLIFGEALHDRARKTRLRIRVETQTQDLGVTAMGQVVVVLGLIQNLQVVISPDWLSDFDIAQIDYARSQLIDNWLKLQAMTEGFPLIKNREVRSSYPYYLHLITFHLIYMARMYRSLSLWSQSTPELMNKRVRANMRHTPGFLKGTVESSRYVFYGE